MIARVLEPEAMETAEEVRQYDAMDHSAVNARFVEDFLAAHGPCRGATCSTSEPARPGSRSRWHLPIHSRECWRLTSRMRCSSRPPSTSMGPDCRAASAVTWAMRSRCSTRFGEGSFEAVISNTIIHHIPEPEPVLDDMARLVAHRGTLFVRDLARPASQDEIVRLADTYAGGETPSARALFEASLGAALTLEEIRSIVSGLGHDPKEVSMTSDRHWTWIWRRP